MIAVAFVSLVFGASPRDVTTLKHRNGPAPRVEPVVGASSKLLFRSMSVELDATRHRDYSLMHKPAGLWGGVQFYYDKKGSFDTGGWRGIAAVGVEPLFPTGGVPLSLQFTSLYAFKRRPRASFVFGASLALAAELPRGIYSHGELGLPLGLSTRRVDLLFTPTLAFPLYVDKRAVYGGTRRRAVALMVMPLSITVRFKVGRDRGEDCGLALH